MNWRLLTEEEKKRNRFERVRRNTLQQAEKRRQLGLLETPAPFVFPTANTFPEVERRRFAPVCSRTRLTPVVWKNIGRTAAEPTLRTLWIRNRGQIPVAYLEAPVRGEVIGADKALAMAKAMTGKISDAAILFSLSGCNAVNLPPEKTAKMASLAGLSFDERAIAKAVGSMRFCEMISRGNVTFQVLTKQRRSRAWCYFEQSDLAILLPKMRVPHILRRLSYLVRLVKPRSKIVGLDFYSVRMNPLFRVPLF